MKGKNVFIIGVLVALIGMVFFMSGCKDETDPVYTKTNTSFEIENKSGYPCTVTVTITASNSASNASKLTKEEIATSGSISFSTGEKKPVTVKDVLVSGKTNKVSRDYIHLIKITVSDGNAHSQSDYTSKWLQKDELKTFDNAHFDITLTSSGPRKFVIKKR